MRRSRSQPPCIRSQPPCIRSQPPCTPGAVHTQRVDPSAIFPKLDRLLARIEDNWGEIESTGVMKALAMWCLIQTFLSDGANLPIDSDWENSNTIEVRTFCGIQTMVNLMSGTKREETMNKLKGFDISPMKDLLSALTGLKSSMFAQLAESTVLELLTQMNETIKLEEILKSRVRALFDLKHLAFTVRGMEEFFFEANLKGDLCVTPETDRVQREWERKVKTVVWKQKGVKEERRRRVY